MKTDKLLDKIGKTGNTLVTIEKKSGLVWKFPLPKLKLKEVKWINKKLN